MKSGGRHDLSDSKANSTPSPESCFLREMVRSPVLGLGGVEGAGTREWGIEERLGAKAFEKTRFNKVNRLVSTGGIVQAPSGIRCTKPPPPGEEIFFDLAILFHRRDSCRGKQLRTHLFDREQNQNNKGLECHRQISGSGLGPIGPGFSPEQRNCGCTLKFLTELKPGTATPTYPSTCQNPLWSAPPHSSESTWTVSSGFRVTCRPWAHTFL